MSDLQNSVRFTWQLVSQFVSWEFCRYMCEQKENNSPVTDVLTFLRNMIVQRTEKSMSEITKHEIVAKFIMETKEVQHISRMSCIIPLSESVKKIFPALEPAVSKLVHYLDTFLNALDTTDESRKELIQQRIEDAIDDFLKEANRLLPQPHLLQVIESWNTHHGQTYPNPVKKVIYNAMLFEKVLECLHFESITPSEAKVIAVSLYEDKVFEKILLNAEAEPETEADSEQYSFSLQLSQPHENIYSQEFVKNSQTCKPHDIPSNLHPPNLERCDPDSLQLDSPPIISEERHDAPDISELQTNMQPPHLIPAISPASSKSPPVYPLLHRDISEQNGFADTRNNEPHNHMQFAQSSANESLSDECNSTVEGEVTRTFRQIYNNQRINNLSNSDTSDCDKNPEIRFLTPTLFKKGKNKNNAPPKPDTVWLSDCESNNSSVITTVINSQKDDPTWSSRRRVDIVELFQNKRKKKAVTVKKDLFKKKLIRQLDSDSDDDGLVSNQANTPFQSLHQPSTSATRTDFENESERPTKRRRENAKLYRSPNISIQDFVSQIRRPVPVVPNGTPVHKGANTRPLRRTTAPYPSTAPAPAQPAKKSSKRNKCKQCTKAFKTVIALRRHVFLKHTEALEDSDCDS